MVLSKLESPLSLWSLKYRTHREKTKEHRFYFLTPFFTFIIYRYFSLHAPSDSSLIFILFLLLLCLLFLFVRFFYLLFLLLYFSFISPLSSHFPYFSPTSSSVSLPPTPYFLFSILSSSSNWFSFRQILSLLLPHLFISSPPFSLLFIFSCLSFSLRLIMPLSISFSPSLHSFYLLLFFFVYNPIFLPSSSYPRSPSLFIL
jgi:hypothetical protein